MTVASLGKVELSADRANTNIPTLATYTTRDTGSAAVATVFYNTYCVTQKFFLWAIQRSVSR